MDKMTPEQAIEILRDKFIEFYPSVAGVKPISIRRAMEIVDLIQSQQSRITELTAGLVEARKDFVYLDNFLNKYAPCIDKYTHKVNSVLNGEVEKDFGRKANQTLSAPKREEREAK